MWKVLVATLALFTIAACGDTDDGTGDADSDARSDVDASVDADAAVDEDAALGEDAAIDAERTDAASDAPDVSEDAETDAAEDGDANVEVDGGPPDECDLRTMYPGPCVADYDYDGTSPIERREVDTYVDGRVTELRMYSFEGDLIYLQLTAYDDVAGTVTWTTDSNGDGHNEQIELERRNAAGRVVENRNDGNADGVWDICHTLEFSGDGRIETYTSDGGCDGVAPQVVVSQLDDMDRLVLVETDLTNDGAIDSRTMTTYSATGYTTFREGASGMIQEFENGTLDADGRPLVVTIDRDPIGDSIDERRATTYDAEGNPVHQTTDLGGDGTLETEITTVYDERGNAIERLQISRLFGELRIRSTSTYDPCGQALVAVIDYGDDGSPDERTVTEVDENGNVLSIAVDHHADGHVDEYVGYDYACFME